MKIVINVCGGFRLSDEQIEELKRLGADDDFIDDAEFGYVNRSNSKLVEAVKKHPNSDRNTTHLSVVDIPDNATDWTVEEYDGAERVLFVVDGKIKRV